MRRSRSPALSYCTASGRDSVWAFKASPRLRSGTRCWGLKVSTAAKGKHFCSSRLFAPEPRRARELVVPHCTYTDPEVAQVSLTPRQAQEEGIPIDEYRLQLAKVERAFIDGEEEGFAAIYTRRGTGEIVGATLVAAHAGEMISELTLAITSKLTMKALAETVHCYPTQAEVFQRIALEYVAKQFKDSISDKIA